MKRCLESTKAVLSTGGVFGVLRNKGFPVTKESPVKIARDMKASLEMLLVTRIGRQEGPGS